LICVGWLGREGAGLAARAAADVMQLTGADLQQAAYARE